MKNSMVMQNDDGSKHHHLCPACRIDYLGDGQAPNNETIPIFYSAKHACDKGWRRTTHHSFSENGQPVWVCPDCWPGDAGQQQ